MTPTLPFRVIHERNSLEFLRRFLKPIADLCRRDRIYLDDTYGQGDVFFWLMPLSTNGIAWSEKRDEIKQASINMREIGFSPFFGQMSVHNRGIAKKDIPLSMNRVISNI
jgi:hypothetical protein